MRKNKEKSWMKKIENYGESKRNLRMIGGNKWEIVHRSQLDKERERERECN